MADLTRWLPAPSVRQKRYIQRCGCLCCYHTTQLSARCGIRSNMTACSIRPAWRQYPRRAAIVRANRYMVDHSTHLIAYCVAPRQ